MRLALALIVVVTLLAGPAGAQTVVAPVQAETPAPPAPKALPTDRSTGRLLGSWDSVARALARGDAGEAQRLAANLSSGQWQAALSQETPEQLDTALALLPTQLGAVAWLPTLATWTLTTEPSQEGNVAKVLRSIGMILGAHDPADAHEWDVPVATVRQVCRGLVWIAVTPTRPLDVRLAALDALGMAQRLCGAVPTALLLDSSPEVRRASVSLVANDPAAVAALRARLDDVSPAVQSLAAARLCRDRAAAPLPEVSAAARKFAVMPATMEDAVDLLECLTQTPSDRAVLEAVSRSGAKAVQARAKQLLQKAP